MKLYITYRDDEDGLYYVARLTGVAKTVAGPFRDAKVAHAHAERLAGPRAVRSTWPAEFQVSEREYAAELHVETLPRECYIVRDLYAAEQVQLAHMAQFLDSDMKAQRVTDVKALGMFVTSPEDDPAEYRREIAERQSKYEAGKEILAEATLVYGREHWVVGTGHTAHITVPLDSPEIAVSRGFVAASEQFVWCGLRRIQEADPIAAEAGEQGILALASAIYSEVYGHLDDKRHSARLTTEIRDWLTEGDEGRGRAVEDLAAEWREYNPDDPDYEA
jgi:hypothetical protein